MDTNAEDLNRMWDLGDLFSGLPADIQACVSFPRGASNEKFSPSERKKIEASSSRATPELQTQKKMKKKGKRAIPEKILPQTRRINDHVYEVCRPAAGRRPSVELIFFHGLLLKGSHEHHLTTWLAANESEMWLTWILQDIPDARILVISYDAHTKRAPKQGLMDMYVTTENLMHCLIDGENPVGQDGCPVVLVGHCIGGLVMKHLCVYVAEKLCLKSNKPSERMQSFLNNIKGLFFYASPHHGTRLADVSKNKGALFEDVTTLNSQASRQNEKFRELRQDRGWRTFGIGEAHKITLGSFRGLVVAEASARWDVDGFYTAAADHFNVCRPESQTSSSFRSLLSFIVGVVKQDQARHRPKIALKEAVGLEQQVTKVLKELRGAPRLGIVGMGGLGKSTLARSVFDTISRNFEYTCFFQDVKLRMGKQVDKLELQDKIIQNLFHKERKCEAGTFDWSALKGRKVFIVLDDVESESQVMVMTEEDSFAADSRVIVTTRETTLIMPDDFKFYTPKLLNDEESKHLFCFHAFKQTNVAKGYEDRVAQFTRKCGGLPLALKVAGRFLRTRPSEVWDDAFLRLERAQALNGKIEDGLWSVLSTSFNSLAEDEKAMFLDVATCFHGELIDDVKELWRTCGWAADIGWTNLLDKGLVTEVYDRGINIQMHEVLRDLGRSKAGNSRMCYDAVQVKPSTWPFHNEENPKAEVLKIRMFDDGTDWMDRPMACYEIRELRKFNSLRVLWVEGGSLHGDCRWFPKELVCIMIKDLHCWMDSTDLGVDPRVHLPALGLEQYCRRLRYLKLKNYWAESLPRSLGQLCALERLTIEKCWRLKTLPSSLGQLHRLKDLEIRDYEFLETLPATLGQLRALERLTIEWCPLKTLPSSIGQLHRLKDLRIRECDVLETLPDTLGQLEALENLSITDSSRLDLSDTVCQLKALKRLVIKHCRSLGNLPDRVGDLRALEHLQITAFSSGKEDMRPNTLGQLVALKHLDIRGCFEEALPENLMKLRRLEYVRIHYVRFGPHLPNNLGELTALKSLHIEECSALEDLPDSIGQLTALEDLKIVGCWGLKSLPKTLGFLHALKTLEVSDCSFFEIVLDGLWELRGLESLKLCQLKGLPATLGQLQGLKRVELDSCDLKSIPDSIGELQALEYLELCDCLSLEALPHSIGKLRALKVLRVVNCRLTEFPSSIGGLKALEELEVEFCSMEALPDSLGLLHALRRLELFECYRVEALPLSLGQLQSLEELYLLKCASLKSLPDTVGQLDWLERLRIWECKSLRDLPDSLKSRLGTVKDVDIPKYLY